MSNKSSIVAIYPSHTAAEAAVKDKFILIAHGSVDETDHAREILNGTKPGQMDHHQ